ncbi:MAG: hypothetical protein KA984_00635 [Candidatus Cloacimonetes bacterium]|nr:hypothetical protein [Candidatus Cloacimonadota bacterium]
MKNTALLALLIIICGLAYADLTWPEPVPVRVFENVSLHNYDTFTSDGCHLISWKDNYLDTEKHWIRLYDQQYQPLWPQPVLLGASGQLSEFIATSDSCFIVFYRNEGIRAIKISRIGQFTWGDDGIFMEEPIAPYTRINAHPDNSGGCYLTWGNLITPNNYQAMLQHLDSEGELTMPGAGVSLGTLSGGVISEMQLRPDNSVILSLYANAEIRICRISMSGQNLWPNPIIINSNETYPDGNLCSFADGSFAISWCTNSQLLVRRYDVDGIAIWPEPVTLQTFQYAQYYSTTLKLASDNSILILAAYNDLYYLHKVSSTGNIILPGGIALNLENNFIKSPTVMIPDTQGGCIVIACMALQDSANSIYAIKITGAGTLSYHPVASNNLNNYNPVAFPHGTDLHIVWQIDQDDESGIYAQILNESLIPTLPGNGIPIRTGPAGEVMSYTVAAMTNGSAVLSAIKQKTGGRRQLMLQRYNEAGQSLFPAYGLQLNNSNTYYIACTDLSVSGDSILVAWVDCINMESYLRIQMISPTGELLYPGEGMALTQAMSVGALSICHHEGAWYIVWEDYGVIHGQKIIGTQLQWGYGLQLATLHPGHESYPPANIRLEWPWLIWGRDDSYDSYITYKHLEPDGSTSPGYPNYGLEFPESYENMTLADQTLITCGDKLHAMLTYNDSNEIPHHYHTLINAQGTALFGPTALSINPNYNVFYKDNHIYIGDYDGQYRLRKYSLSGELLSTHHTPIPDFNVDSWEVPYAGFLDNGNLLLCVRGIQQGVNNLRHYYLTPTMSLITPMSNIIFGNNADYLPRISARGDNAWITWRRGVQYNIYFEEDGSYSNSLYLQGISPEGSYIADDIHYAPVAPIVENCRPNPFNPTTTIDFSVPQACKARLCIYDLRGRKIRTLLDEELLSGKHSVVWDGKDDDGLISASGIYFIRLDAGEMHHVRKVSLVK